MRENPGDGGRKSPSLPKGNNLLAETVGDTITLTRRQLLELSQGLKQLDAIRENEKDLVPLAFDTKVSYRLMRSSVVVEREKALFDKLDRQAAKDAGFFEGMAANDESAKKADEYNRRRADILDEEVKIEGVMLVSVEQLLSRPEEFKKSKRNPVPQSVLNRLAPILEEESE